jgi:hypothetical protein
MENSESEFAGFMTRDEYIVTPRGVRYKYKPTQRIDKDDLDDLRYQITTADYSSYSQARSLPQPTTDN